MFRRILCIVAGLTLLAGCKTTEEAPIATLPPISQPATGVSNPGQVIWHDLATPDLAASKEFYGELLGWSFEQLNDRGRRYTAVYNGEAIIGGMFEFTSRDRKDPTGEWLINLSSADVAGAAAAFTDAGGEIIEPARAVPNRGTAAFVRDPQEAVMVLVDSSTGDPTEEFVPIGSWLWNELWTHDGPAANAFYSDLFGYDTEEMKGLGGRKYYLLSKGGTPVGGILEIQNKDIRPHWVPFVRVEDLQVSLVLAATLGANVLIEPDNDIRDGKVALIQSPTGEPLVLQEYSFEPGQSE
ncbi:MAG: VOC family protein [Puniceicoccaceae bacterium]